MICMYSHKVIIIKIKNSLYLKLRVTAYCIICGQPIYLRSFLNCMCQYLSFLNIFFNRFCPVEKCGFTPHGLYTDNAEGPQKTRRFLSLENLDILVSQEFSSVQSANLRHPQHLSWSSL